MSQAAAHPTPEARGAAGRTLRLSARGLLRDLRASDVRALFLALALAVAASTMIGFFLDRLDRGLTRQAGQLLGGDLVLEQSRPFEAELRRTLAQAGLELSDQTGMVTMVSFDDAFHPASLKAVDGRYPLYGEVLVDLGQGEESVPMAPPPARPGWPRGWRCCWRPSSATGCRWGRWRSPWPA